MMKSCLWSCSFWSQEPGGSRCTQSNEYWNWGTTWGPKCSAMTQEFWVWSFHCRIGISKKDTTILFRQTTTQLSRILRPPIDFYERHEIAKTIPKDYEAYPRLRCIVDCSEIFIQRPHELKLQAATWPDYKHHNPLKFLIGITPQGSIC